MFSGDFIQAMHEEFYRTFPQFNPRVPAFTSVERRTYRDFGWGYLMGDQITQ